MTPPPMTTTEAWEGRAASGMVCSCRVRARCPGEPTVRPRFVLLRDHRQGPGGTSRGVARLRRAGGWYAENVSRWKAGRPRRIQSTNMGSSDSSESVRLASRREIHGVGFAPAFAEIERLESGHLLHLPGRRRRPRRADRLLRQAARRARRVRFCMAGFTLQVDFFDHALAVFTD